MIDIIIPSYGRSSRIRSVVENIHDNTILEHKIYVVVEREGSELPAYSMALYGLNDVLIANTRSKNYAGAVNTAIQWGSNPYVFLAADDLNFHSGWDHEAMRVMNAIDTVKVVGTNDLLNTFVLQGLHATHYLISRDYLQDPGGVVDGDPGHALYEGYDHNYTDTEFIGTAKARAVFAPCLTAVVEHLHWTAGKMEADATTKKTEAMMSRDCELYEIRQPMWWNLSK